jgi:hypothetical protein
MHSFSSSLFLHQVSECAQYTFNPTDKHVQPANQSSSRDTSLPPQMLEFDRGVGGRGQFSRVLQSAGLSSQVPDHQCRTMVVSRSCRSQVRPAAGRHCTGRRRRPLTGQQARQMAALRSVLPVGAASDLQVLLEAIRYIGQLRQQLGVH